MRNVFRVACSMLLGVAFLPLAAAGQVLTGGQILPTNTITYIPPTNGAPSTLVTVSVPQTISTIGNQNFGTTNQLNGTAYLSYNGIFICQLIQAWGSNGSAFSVNTNLTYNPAATNNAGSPDIVYTLPTNLTFGITYGMAVTNLSSTNDQVTINRTK
jgi:hypothetical protein